MSLSGMVETHRHKERLVQFGARWQIDLNSLFREPQGLATLRNSDQIDSESCGPRESEDDPFRGGC